MVSDLDSIREQGASDDSSHCCQGTSVLHENQIIHIVMRWPVEMGSRREASQLPMGGSIIQPSITHDFDHRNIQEALQVPLVEA